MTRLIVILLPLLILASHGLGWWVQRTMRRYSEPADRYDGTGAQLARHLLERHGLGEVAVELSEIGDHYDLEARAVRLSPDNYHGRSLTAITVAAHEVGHALQHAQGYAPLRARERLVRVAAVSLAVVLALGLATRHFMTVTPAGF
ncbi:MAG TPA: zinc metallopeptidase, partial [Rhodocyclaceae bacterium]|nr:zinc metallopeptidase [Rhodocyclaceae bacterium]